MQCGNIALRTNGAGCTYILHFALVSVVTGGYYVIVIAQVPGIYGSKQTESEGVA